VLLRRGSVRVGRGRAEEWLSPQKSRKLDVQGEALGVGDRRQRGLWARSEKYDDRKKTKVTGRERKNVGKAERRAYEKLNSQKKAASVTPGDKNSGI